MKEDFVSYDIAVKLKDKGFKYNKMNLIDKICMENQINYPTISQALKWLREEKKIYLALDFFRFNGNTELWWTYTVRYIEDDSTENIFESCKRKSWEQAALAGIEFVLDNLI